MLVDTDRISDRALVYDQNAKYCPETGLITLDVLYCQVCGEVYYRAYRAESRGRQRLGSISISNEAESPSSEAFFIHVTLEGQETLQNWDRGWLRPAQQCISQTPGREGHVAEVSGLLQSSAPQNLICLSGLRQ